MAASTRVKDIIIIRNIYMNSCIIV